MARVPAIRINDFLDEWAKESLGEITSSYSGGTPSAGNAKYYGGNIPFIRSGEISENKTALFLTEAGFNSSSAEMVKAGDILYALYGATSGEVSRAKINGAINQAILAILPKQGVDAEYLVQWLRNQKENIISVYLQGGQGNLSGALVKALEVDVPSYNEQKRIGVLFESFDNLISLHQKRLDKLVLTKKAMLRKMFPQNGNPIPEIRFKGFNDAWEQCMLGEVAAKVTKKNSEFIVKETFTNSAEFGIISQRDYFDKNVSNSENIGGYYVVSNDDFVYNPRVSALAPVGPINRNKLGRAGVMSPLYTVFSTHDIDPTYLEWFFKNDTWHEFMYLNGDNGARHDRFSIRDKAFFKMPVGLPQLSEQRMIGSFFETLDNMIMLQAEKLKKLKNTKKALLSKMFV